LLAGAVFPAINAVFGLAAITDIVEYAAGTNDCETATALFMGSTATQASELYQTANPASLDLHSQTLLLHGTADSIVNVSQSVLPNVRTLGVEEAGHFDWVHPGTEAFRLLLDSLEKLF
jgi:pimeloyl-ACP methyl ester carboxylesterase